MPLWSAIFNPTVYGRIRRAERYCFDPLHLRTVVMWVSRLQKEGSMTLSNTGDFEQMISRVTEQTRILTNMSPAHQRLQINNILCPVDFSAFSDCALRYAVGLARHFGSRLFVQHTASPPNDAFAAGMEGSLGLGGLEQVESGYKESAPGEQRPHLETVREKMRQMLISNGIDTSEAIVLLNEGFIPQRIFETIDAEQIDLVVMGTHGHKGFSHLILGSVTESIVHQAACPVLTVSRPRQGSVGLMQLASFKTILLATDFSSRSERALAYALKWASEWGARIKLFHAVQEHGPAMRGLVDLFPEYNPYFERQVAGAWRKIRSEVPEAAKQWCDVSYEVRHGNPKEEIPRVAEEIGADLIITGARGIGFSDAGRGSVSSTVVRDGRFPVLVVRELSLQVTQHESNARVCASPLRWLPIGSRRHDAMSASKSAQHSSAP
jgi:nucleotide-binding universal stress UspA family protein